MTRRIAFAILAIVWIALITAGFSTYFITRSLLLRDLDDTILGRIASLPEIERPASLRNTSDRYVIQNADNRTVASSTTAYSEVPPPVILSASFGDLPEGPRRILKVQVYKRRALPTEPLEPLTVVFSASAASLERLLNNLMLSLGGFGLIAAAATALVARAVAHVALRPMRDTADVIGTIDEKSLDRRIDVARLPVELAPVGHRLNDMLARLESAFAQRKQFLADASHELRTPVAGLVTTLEVALRRRRDHDDYVRTLESCLSDARLLHQLIIALLDQVRSERFDTQVELAPVPVSTLLRHCGHLAATLGAAKNIRVEQEIPDNLLVITDEQKLRSIVVNLLSNAIEYTPPGGTVRLLAQLAPPQTGATPLPSPASSALPDGLDPAAFSATARRLVVRVIDTGPGIAPEHLPNLFEPFYRADAARTNPEHHLGLGLSIVRAHVQALGGECTVRSPAAPGAQGCEFTVELPMSHLEQVPEISPVRPAPRAPKPLQQEPV